MFQPCNCGLCGLVVSLDSMCSEVVLFVTLTLLNVCLSVHLVSQMCRFLGRHFWFWQENGFCLLLPFVLLLLSTM